jgi:uncharacterized protein with PIN domain
MPDPADQAQAEMEREEIIRDMQRAAALNSQSRLRPKGRCHYCNEPFETPEGEVVSPLLFCPGEESDKSECSEDYEQMQRFQGNM